MGGISGGSVDGLDTEFVKANELISRRVAIPIGVLPDF